MPLWPKDSEQSRRRFRGLTIMGVSLLLILFVSLLWLNSGTTDGIVSNGQDVENLNNGWKKPEGLQIVALVFYGRRANVQILERYLRVFAFIHC
jgi:hypothetical protein